MLDIVLGIVFYILRYFAVIVPLLIALAYFTLCDRKIMGAMQRRIGPAVVGPYGLLQPLADGLKLVIKENIAPIRVNRFLYTFAPTLTFVISMVCWVLIPLTPTFVSSDPGLGLLFVFATSSLGIYGIIISGWSSNSKYPLFGALRASAQMISYEVSMGLIYVCVGLCAGSYNLTEIVLAQKEIWFAVPLLPLFIIYLVSMLAETNRTPFDLAEAEAELVAGYSSEYSGVNVSLFFMAEYANMLLLSALCIILFCGGWLIGPFGSGLFFTAKMVCFVFYFVWVRGTFPRYRYDQLMQICWKMYLPISLFYVIFVSLVLFIFNGFPC